MKRLLILGNGYHIGNKYEKDNVNMNIRQYFNEELDVISFNFFKCTGDTDMFFSKIIDCVIKGNKKLIVYWHGNVGRKNMVKNIEYYVKDNLNYERVKNIPLNIEFVKILIPR